MHLQLARNQACFSSGALHILRRMTMLIASTPLVSESLCKPFLEMETTVDSSHCAEYQNLEFFYEMVVPQQEHFTSVARGDYQIPRPLRRLALNSHFITSRASWCSLSYQMDWRASKIGRDSAEIQDVRARCITSRFTKSAKCKAFLICNKCQLMLPAEAFIRGSTFKLCTPKRVLQGSRIIPDEPATSGSVHTLPLENLDGSVVGRGHGHHVRAPPAGGWYLSMEIAFQMKTSSILTPLIQWVRVQLIHNIPP